MTGVLDLAEERVGPRVAIETHGCKLNQADSTQIAWEFVESGFRVVSTDEPADVYVVNTCTVTHVADRKARQSLRAARRRNPDAVVVAAGCYVERAPEVLDGLDEVDMVVGNTDKPELVRRVLEWRGDTPVPCAVGAEPDGYNPRVLRTRGMVKIQHGCNQVCAYCIVPKVRGRERSVPPADVVAQVRRYLDLGYMEVVLTGTQLGSYGFDLEGEDLPGLIERVLADTDVPRLRVSSLQPQEIDSRLLDIWSDRRLCPHFHMPLQSASPPVLKRMRRRYTPERYAEAVELIRTEVPGSSVTADVIAGFPGETEEDFEATYRFCEGMGFASMHVFPYSTRPGTSAAHFKDHAEPHVKSDRVRRLLRLADTSAADYRQGQLGSTRPVLWESSRAGNAGDSEYVGLTDNYVRVIAASDRNLTNTVTDATLLCSEGELVRAEAILRLR